MCAFGETCVAGRCEAIPCSLTGDGGFICPGHRVCGDVVDPLTDDSDHGCVPIACAVDADCAADFCVQGTCSPTPGTCELPRP
jgi:hypothetical protein